MREIRFVAYVHLRNRSIAKDTPSFIQPWSHGYSATTLECEGVTPGDEKVRRATVIAESADKKAIAAKSVAESAGHFYENFTDGSKRDWPTVLFSLQSFPSLLCRQSCGSWWRTFHSSTLCSASSISATVICSVETQGPCGAHSHFCAVSARLYVRLLSPLS